LVPQRKPDIEDQRADAQPKHHRDERFPIPLDPEEAIRALVKVDPDAPPAKRNEDEQVEEPEPLKDQGDPLAWGVLLLFAVVGSVVLTVAGALVFIASDQLRAVGVALTGLGVLLLALALYSAANYNA
jgi:hypothetical protein